MRGYQDTYTDDPPYGFGGHGVTYMVRRLILINAAVFAAQLLLAPLETLTGVSVAEWFGFVPGDFLRGSLWQPLTYQFLHGGLMHLVMNMLWLFFFGPDVERLLGSRQFTALYLACGGVGVMVSLFSLGLFGNNPVIVGASGSVLGVLVAFAVADPARQVLLFPLPVPMSAATLVAIVAALNLVWAFGETNASVSTHLGGMGMGWVMMQLIPRYQLWLRRRNRERWQKRNPGGGEDDPDNIFEFRRRD
ncbi:MAG TPA: rhomboid family intramembrane serine protease [Candidatus Hydrogenedentes bacterium]|nr:rhomboid family intramembrane serine protease [Candidatus Hydrogenedentota bacterium]